MTYDRRFLFRIGACALVLAGCGGEPATPVMTVHINGRSGMNPGPDGADRPVTVSILQMSGSSAFDGADVFALQDPVAAVGTELVKAEQIVLAPGASAVRLIALQAGATVIGVTAGFRDPSGKVVRKTMPAPSADITLDIDVSSGGLTVAGT